MEVAADKDELLERDASLALLEALLHRAASSGQGGTVVVTGEAGIGKSALVDHFLGRAGAARQFVGGCEALATPRPLGPVHDFAARLPPAVRRMLDDGTHRAALFACILEELVHGPGAALLVLEDVHWADAATLDVVKFIGRRIRRHPVLMILTARDDPASWEAVARTLADLPAGQLTRIGLQPLSLQAVEQLAGPGAGDARALHDATGGNPFFVAEVLRSGRNAGRVPHSVRDAVLAAAASLLPPARDLLEQVSLFPRQLPVAFLHELPVALDAVDACVARGLLLLEDGTVRFRHELARAAIEDAIPPVRARALHSAALAVLVSRAAAGAVAPAQLAHHAQRAWDTAAVARWAPEAAREAAAQGALREAVAHFRAALAVGEALPPAERAALLEGLGRSHFELSDLEAAAAGYRAAIALYGQLGMQDAQARCLASLAMPLVRLLRNAEADEAARAALELACLPGAPAAAAAHATQSYLRMLNRDHHEAIAAGERAIALAGEGDRATLARAYTSMGAATLFLDYARGCGLLEKSMEVAQGLPDGGAGVADGYLMLSTASAELFEFDAADRFLEEGIAFARGHDLDRQARYMEAWAALCDLYRGRWASAGPRADQVLAVERQASTSRVMALVALGRLRTRRGDPGAGEVLDEALQLALRSGTLQRLAPVCLARAEAAWLRHDSAGVLAEVDRVESLARAKSHAWFLGELAFWRGQAGDPAPAGKACAPPFRLQLQGRWEDAARDWRARGCPYEEARALADGDEPAQRAALTLLDQLGAAPLAARVRDAMRAGGLKAVPRGPVPATRANPAGLTRREVEVLQLLAQDLRPAQIAARLSRSVRTVDHHVEALYAKLEVSSRAQALSRAQGLGLLGEK